MVSSLSSRLLAGSRDSSSGNTSPRYDRNEGSISAYSADREGPSYPPVVSINLHSKSRSSFREESMTCAKRRKTNEMAFAATTVKSDLARAGKEFKTVDKKLERSTILKDMNINLKDHVKLLHSNDITGSLVPPSNIGRKSVIADYAALSSAVSEFYPSKPSRMSDIKSFERRLPAGQNSWSEPSSSSVSDTLSDSGSDNTNNVLPPLLEDSLDLCTKQVTKKEERTMKTADRYKSISSVSNTITMTEILQLSKTARVVTNSSAPFSVIHANAAFHRLSGETSALIGKPFHSLLDPEANPSEENISLASYMTSPSQGDGHKLYLLPKKSGGGASDEQSEPVKCTIRVSPVLDQRTLIHETVHVEYFVAEFVSEGKEFDETAITNKSSVPFTDSKTPMGVVA